MGQNGHISAISGPIQPRISHPIKQNGACMIAQGLVMYKRVVISAIYYELNASGYSRGDAIKTVWGLRICPPDQPVIPSLPARRNQPQVEYLWLCRGQPQILNLEQSTPSFELGTSGQSGDQITSKLVMSWLLVFQLIALNS